MAKSRIWNGKNLPTVKSVRCTKQMHRESNIKTNDINCVHGVGYQSKIKMFIIRGMGYGQVNLLSRMIFYYDLVNLSRWSLDIILVKKRNLNRSWHVIYDWKDLPVQNKF